MMSDDFKVLFRIVKRAPLGLRFRDIAYGSDVTDGLHVTGVQVGKTYPVFTAAHSPVSGIYGFYRLPGMSAYQDPVDPDSDEIPGADVCADGDPANWIIRVTDTFGRYLPQVLPICLPQKKLFPVELYSSPNRTAKAGYAVIRGEIWNKAEEKPASWAVVSVTDPIAANDYVSVANGRGMFVVFMPYPKPIAGTELPKQEWSLDINILYQPSAQQWSGQAEPTPDPNEDIEDAKQRIPPDSNTLTQQSPAGIFDDTVATVATLSAPLKYRADLVLKTQTKNRLWVASV